MPGKKHRSTPQLVARRRSKALFLPIGREQADEMVMAYRVALEAVRAGHGDGKLLRRLYSMVLLTRYITEAGHGELELSVLEAGEGVLVKICERGDAGGDWAVDAATIELLSCIVNEHDRQMRETRLQVLLDASNRLDRLIAG
ncbi:hypothetical protein BVER_03533 [Candidatus Burkholderia verschuerenii]|uniref:Fis family transcriptional regulator n=2 Tax=Candidatus Burkholderia verschuerenii TaxID=242163 RepID=A0A0L0M9H9_9BURK|nr:hypothetical protein BVER_03533 [Candidatus Burkholderia verschuerenii]